jgi:hypothetical protein
LQELRFDRSGVVEEIEFIRRVPVTGSSGKLAETPLWSDALDTVKTFFPIIVDKLDDASRGAVGQLDTEAYRFFLELSSQAFFKRCARLHLVPFLWKG